MNSPNCGPGLRVKPLSWKPSAPSGKVEPFTDIRNDPFPMKSFRSRLFTVVTNGSAPVTTWVTVTPGDTVWQNPQANPKSSNPDAPACTAVPPIRLSADTFHVKPRT